MAKVLVTGAAGFIGSHLVDQLLARGDEVVAVDDLSLGRAENLAHVADRITLIRARIQDLATHRAALEGVTRIYHLAALISGYDSLKTPDEYVDANVTGLLRVIDVARTLPGCRLLLASSSTVYGNRTDPVRRESDLPSPITVYALSKLAGEHLLQMYGELYGLDHVSLRLFNVYGPRQNPDHPYANVTCKFSRAAALGLGVQLYGDGQQTRDFVYVDDVVSAFLAVSGPTRERIYNVGTGEDASIAELLAHAQAAGEVALSVTQLPPWPNDIRAIRADASRLRAETGWAPSVTLREGLRRTIAFFREGARA